jgi:hypothetical protein
MKWLTVEPGDVRERRVFAWRATKCTDGFTRRFEWLRVREVYSTPYSSFLMHSDNPTPYWKAVSILPVKADPDAEAEAAVAKAIRESRKPVAPAGLTISIGDTYGISFGTPRMRKARSGRRAVSEDHV